MMNNESPEVKNDSEAQTLCKRGCGFYGSVQFKDMCSKCYQEQIKHETGIQQTSITRSSAAELSETHNCISSRLDHPAAAASESGTATTTTTTTTTQKCHTGGVPPMRTGSTCVVMSQVHHHSLKRKATNAPAPSSAEVKDTTSVPSAPRVNRCTWCRKRVGLTGFVCRCEGLFCSLHRYSDQHECSYDYQANGRIELAKANPEVRCPKIRKI